MRESDSLAAAIVTALEGHHVDAFAALVDEAVHTDPAGVIEATATLVVAPAEPRSSDPARSSSRYTARRMLWVPGLQDVADDIAEPVVGRFDGADRALDERRNATMELDADAAGRESPAGGWYPDPAGRAESRYWDRRWTAHVQTDGRLSLSPLQPGHGPPGPPPGPKRR